jgi:hypothetical protein
MVEMEEPLYTSENGYCASVMGNSMEVSQKFKNRSTM